MPEVETKENKIRQQFGKIFHQIKQTLTSEFKKPRPFFKKTEALFIKTGHL